MKTMLLVIGALFLASSAMAGDCSLTIKRVPCPGKADEAFKPYGGKEVTHESKKVGSAEACAKEAEKACAIVRKGILKAKEITALYSDAAVEGGKNFCDANRPDFNQCK